MAADAASDLQLTAILLPDVDGGFTAVNLETGTTSQGETTQEAIANLAEATSLYLEEFPLTSIPEVFVTTFSVSRPT